VDDTPGWVAGLHERFDQLEELLRAANPTFEERWKRRGYALIDALWKYRWRAIITFLSIALGGYQII